VKRIFVQNRFHSAAHKVGFAQRRVFVHVSIALCGLRLAVANKPFDHGQRRALGHRYAGGSMAQVMQTNLLMLSACANARPRFAEIDHPPLRTRAGKDERASSCAGSLIIKHRQRRVAQTNRLAPDLLSGSASKRRSAFTHSHLSVWISLSLAPVRSKSLIALAALGDTSSEATIARIASPSFSNSVHPR
jgi:hypothetical protein